MLILLKGTRKQIAINPDLVYLAEWDDEEQETDITMLEPADKEVEKESIQVTTSVDLPIGQVITAINLKMSVE